MEADGDDGGDRTISGKARSSSMVRFTGTRAHPDGVKLREAMKLSGTAQRKPISVAQKARHADAEETRLLRLAPGAILLVSEAIDAEAEQPIQYALSRFPADRLELIV